MAETGSYIAGKFVSVANPDGEIVRINPANQDDTIGRFAFSKAHAQDAVEAASSAFASWSRLSEQRRWDYLDRLAALIKKSETSLAKTITREIGKPYWEALQELATVQGKFALTKEAAHKLIRIFQVPAKNSAITAQCRFKARGPLAILAPFNFPLHLALGHVIPALATGNTVVLKPSELAPAISEALALLFHDAQFPSGVFNLVQGDAQIGQTLCMHPEIRGVLFTGSYAVGKTIQKNLLDDPQKIVVLEMGGKNASVIWEDAPIDHAVALALQSATLTTGQRCTCTSRLYVHEKIWKPCLEKLKFLAESLSIGEPMKENTFMGPLVSASAKERFDLAQEGAKKSGLKALLTNRSLPQTGHFVAPSIHLVESLDAFHSDEEIFGPDLVVYPVKDLQQAIHFVEKSRYGLASSIYCQNEEIYQEFFHAVTAGVINWNRPTTGASSALPFGGQKASGNQFPTAYFAPYYCTYPVANMLGATDILPVDSYPGFPT